jgi:hypothetical protein
MILLLILRNKYLIALYLFKIPLYYGKKIFFYLYQIKKLIVLGFEEKIIGFSKRSSL